MASGRETNGHNGHAGAARERASARRARAYEAQVNRVKDAIDAIPPPLVARARAHPIAAVAMGVGALAILGLALRSQAGRMIVMLVGGLALQQLFLIRAGVGLRSRPVEP
jgi:hypothetical protein